MVLQWDHGDHIGTEPGQTPTVSVPAPSAALAALRELTLTPAVRRVLDVGTGSGWTAALLAALVPHGTVTTLEIDPHTARRADTALTRSGARVRTIQGDGLLGDPQGGCTTASMSACRCGGFPPR